MFPATSLIFEADGNESHPGGVCSLGRMGGVVIYSARKYFSGGKAPEPKAA